MSEIKKSTIIKLRQEEADTVETNGSFKVVLNGPPVLLEEGDTCAIKTAIIDSSVESTIVIDEDIIAVLGIGKYIRNFDGPGKATGPPALPGDLSLRKFTDPDSANLIQATADGEFYILGEGGTATNEDILIEKITVFPQHKNGIHDMGFLTLSYTYTDMNNNKQTWSHYMKGRVQQNHPDGFDIPVGITSRNGTFVYSGGVTNFHDYKIDHISVTKGPPGTVVVGSKWIHPDIEYAEIKILAGRYTPGEIATIITDSLSNRESGAISSGGDIFPTDGTVLTTFWQHRLKVEDYVPSQEQFLIRASSPNTQGGFTIQKAMKVTSSDDASNRYIGTNEISLTYDTNLKKLAWDIMHFPIYVTDPGAPATAQAIPGIVFDGVEAQASYSGIFFYSMTPDSFWNKQLGFPSMTTQWINQTQPMKIDNVDYYPFLTDPQAGLNTTSVFNGLDLAVEHTLLFSTPPPLNAGQDIPPVATGLTLPIVASREFDKAPNDEGYYLIEIGFQLPQKLIGGSNGSIGARNNNRVQSVMGKYFTSGNFLQDTGAGSIVYQHMGEPLMVSELDITIRRPDGSIPDQTEIGPNNSIFLEIAKTLSVVPPSTN